MPRFSRLSLHHYTWDYRNRLIELKELEEAEGKPQEREGTDWGWGNTMAKDGVLPARLPESLGLI